jgi:hypothetical protein
MRTPLLVVLLVLVGALPALATTFYVPADYPYIQDAIDAASYGDSVIVACAEFYQQPMITMKSGVCLLSETAEPDCTVLRGQPNSWTVIHCDGCDNATRIQGFTINYARLGGCVDLVDSAPTFANCIFLGGDWSWAVSMQNSAPVFEDCIFRGGTSVFLNYDTVLSFTATRCIFEEVIGYTIPCVELFAYTATFEDCIFRNNGMGEEGTTVLSLNCIDGYIGGCSFHDNLGPCEYAESVLDLGMLSTAIIESCTFTHNHVYSTSPQASVIRAFQGSTIMVNTLIAFNTGNAKAIDCVGGAVIPSCSDIYGNAGGDWVGCIEELEGLHGNISLDPILCGYQNPEAPLSLRTDSPCAPFTPPNPECDLIGAWPVGCDFTAVEEEASERIQQVVLSPCKPNPGGESFRIHYAIPERYSGDPVRLEIYDAAGRLVNALIIGNAAPGNHTVSWDGRDGLGRKVPTGIYSYRLDVGGESTTRRLIVMR